jgi:hypothetical protein
MEAGLHSHVSERDILQLASSGARARALLAHACAHARAIAQCRATSGSRGNESHH